VPIATAQFTLTSNVRQQIVSASTQPQHVCIHNHEHNSNKQIFIGNSTVTLTTGIHAVATQTSMITIGAGDDLWAIAEETGAQIHVLTVKQD
jgi:hypothetical protein